MKSFNSIENIIRKNFSIYIFLRRLAPFICKFIDLEEGFSFSKRVAPIKNNFVILDIGSNDGTSIQMLRRYFPKTRIIAVDPIEKPRFKLSNVTLIKTALGETTGTRNLVTPVVNGKHLTQYSSFYKEKMIRQICTDMDLVEESVSTVITEVNFNTIDNLDVNPFFIKVDVEGAELGVLKGAIGVINEFSPVVLIEIQNKEIYKEVKLLLSALGYKNIEPDNLSKKMQPASPILEISEYRSNSNNYIWINPTKAVSWKFK